MIIFIKKKEKKKGEKSQPRHPRDNLKAVQARWKGTRSEVKIETRSLFWWLVARRASASSTCSLLARASEPAPRYSGQRREGSLLPASRPFFRSPRTKPALAGRGQKSDPRFVAPREGGLEGLPPSTNKGRIHASRTGRAIHLAPTLPATGTNFERSFSFSSRFRLFFVFYFPFTTRYTDTNSNSSATSVCAKRTTYTLIW